MTKEDPAPISVVPTTAPGETGNRPAASLFQRIFHRSKSVDQKASEQPPAVPCHRDDNGNNEGNIGKSLGLMFDFPTFTVLNGAFSCRRYSDPGFY